MGSKVCIFGHRRSGQIIDGTYVDGLSLTHGSPPIHIWTFASGMLSGTRIVILSLMNGVLVIPVTRSPPVNLWEMTSFVTVLR